MKTGELQDITDLILKLEAAKVLQEAALRSLREALETYSAQLLQSIKELRDDTN